MKRAAWLLVVFAIACGSREDRRAETALAEVALPELSSADPPVQAQIRDRYAVLTKAQQRGATGRELGAAFGEYGMLLHAAEYLDAARPAYENAQRLMPDDPRWPFYLGHLHRAEGDTEAAMAAYRRTLDLRPNDVAALVWLGRMHLDHGQPDLAAPLFEHARGVAPNVVAVQVGLAQAALARKDYARAVQLLESALEIDPSAASIYSPLAMAYRGLGQVDKAESLAALWRNTEIAVPDPLKAELDMTLQSGLSFELRGVRALENRDFTTAAGLFRQGLAVAPAGTSLHRSLRHKLGTALALSGDTAGAVREFEETVAAAPVGAYDEPAAKASYSLGVLYAGNGRVEQAVTHLTAALRFNANYFEARIALGDVLHGAGRAAASLPHYDEAMRLNPRAVEPRLGYAMALSALGRYAQAKAFLEASVAAQPARPELTNALARLLAAAPDAGVRDGRRALALAEQLARSSQNPEVGETMAMALAAVGSFQDAVSVQRSLIDSARQAGLEDQAARLTATLRLYENGRPSRSPWPEGAAVLGR